MFVILVKSKKIKQADLTGDGPATALTITKHYRSVREKAGGKIKSKLKPIATPVKPQTKQDKKKLFTYAFAFMSLGTLLLKQTRRCT